MSHAARMTYALICYAVFQVALTLGCMLLLLKKPNYDQLSPDDTTRAPAKAAAAV